MGCVQSDENDPAGAERRDVTEEVARPSKRKGRKEKGDLPPPPGNNAATTASRTGFSAAPKNSLMLTPSVHQPRSSANCISTYGSYQGSVKMPAAQILVGEATRWTCPPPQSSEPLPSNPTHNNENPLISVVPSHHNTAAAGVRPSQRAAARASSYTPEREKTPTPTPTPQIQTPPEEDEEETYPTTLAELPDSVVFRYHRELHEYEKRFAADEKWTMCGLLEAPLPKAVTHTMLGNEERRLKRRWKKQEDIDAIYSAVATAIADSSDTCCGAGRNTDRAKRSRENIASAISHVRTSLKPFRTKSKPFSKLNLAQLYTSTNAIIYTDVLEATPYIGVSRGEGSADVNAGSLKVFPSDRVDSALGELQNYLRSVLVLPGVNAVEVVARTYCALVSIHVCGDGNGRTSACIAAVLAEALGLPPPNLKGSTLIRSFGGQVGWAKNPTPLNAAIVCIEQMHQTLNTDNSGDEGSNGITPSPSGGD